MSQRWLEYKSAPPVRWLVSLAALVAGFLVIQTSITLRSSKAAQYADSGSASLDKGDYAAAERDFRAAVAVYPEAGGARFGLGQSLYLQGKKGEALQQFTLYTEESHDAPKAEFLVADFLLQQNDPHALPLVRKLLQQEPDNLLYASMLERSQSLQSEKQ